MPVNISVQVTNKEEQHKKYQKEINFTGEIRNVVGYSQTFFFCKACRSCKTLSGISERNILLTTTIYECVYMEEI